MKEVKSLGDIIGLEVQSILGGNVEDQEIIINFTDGNTLKMCHLQDCCESVCITDVDGNIQDLVGGKVVQFDESVSENSGDEPDYHLDSWTWTFYNIATTKGFVNIRWLGDSNGYYSESVDIFIKCEYKKGDNSTFADDAGCRWKLIN